ncbi:putative Oxidoreductase [Vibrio nigripulchritudo SFn27]|uniref:Putative Oxidoreductase n=1 Tax=Vibrio nigripulchritudo TaxID=28173 RepID=U4KFY7_9VIBR|nr:Gfo/Idh/MocA family oxidoreductase [Vibrio nigripulchritudo]CCN82652.1 putative Oxidoreductase [Vibrio nigripulchritudo BLFn1]CCN89802.1 putative Oxidoreductase [Vibrio nigripulchritudo SFn27]CCN92199.1 putative Oxidoreductase [Vibrio nigripulchritudo ENn2]CCO43686.1 putative Oxidoreductase [Vibrio nigripulchritudo SFn135]CCO53000.1 putative Oxidoreductase [Vibrio nigripulchritudo Wn13]
MFNEETQLTSPIRWGLIGGGRGSEIGYSHRAAAARDRLFNFVAGALDIDHQRCIDFGINLGLEEDRCYANYKVMFEQEARREDGIQAVSIATPNATHYEIAKAALEAGLHVICEKPVTFQSNEALELKYIASENNLMLAVMYGYTGHVMVQQAREMVQRGDIGSVRVIQMQFAHGYHNVEVEKHSPGAKWRMNPEVSGPSFIIGDCGTHAFYLAELITGLEVTSLLCSKQSFIESRAPLEDNAHVIMNFNNGAVGTMWASAINSGSMHQQKIRVVGEKASIEWWDEYPNQLRYEVQGEPAQVLERGMPYLYNDVAGVNSSRIGGGHGEGFFESWANLYHRFALAIDAFERNDKAFLDNHWYPDINAGISGVKFVESCVKSADNGAIWVNCNE